MQAAIAGGITAVVTTVLVVSLIQAFGGAALDGFVDAVRLAFS